MSGGQPVRRSGVGAMVLALVLIFVGGYYVLRNTLGLAMPELDSDQVVPVIAVALGLAILYRAWQDRN
jgi:NADH:ubiquinone oxidoreductase subunit 4 (subunit M)